jgi:hypothetical protein
VAPRMHGSGGATAMTDLILKRAPIGSNLEDYSVLEDGVVVGRVFDASATDEEWQPRKRRLSRDRKSSKR